MKFLKKLKSSNFWVSMFSAVVLILQAVFNVEIKTEYLTQIIMAILGLLVMSGIVTDSATDEVTVKQNIDMTNVKESVTNILTQVASTLESNISGIAKQFESIGEKLSFTNLFNSKQEESAKEEIVNQEQSANVKEESVSAETTVNETTQTNINVAVVESVSSQSMVDEQNTL